MRLLRAAVYMSGDRELPNSVLFELSMNINNYSHVTSVNNNRIPAAKAADPSSSGRKMRSLSLQVGVVRT